MRRLGLLDSDAVYMGRHLMNAIRAKGVEVPELAWE